MKNRDPSIHQHVQKFECTKLELFCFIFVEVIKKFMVTVLFLCHPVYIIDILYNYYRHFIYIIYNYYKYIIPDIGLAVRVFANGPGDLGSIPGRVIPKTQKMVLDASLLNTQHYKVRIKGKVEQSWEGVAPSPTSWCSSYRKGSLRVTLNYGRQLYLLTNILYDYYRHVIK